jgi:hypothetical protein
MNTFLKAAVVGISSFYGFPFKLQLAAFINSVVTGQRVSQSLKGQANEIFDYRFLMK